MPECMHAETIKLSSVLEKQNQQHLLLVAIFLDCL